MKKIVFCLSLGLVSLFAHAQHGLEKVIVERYYVSNKADSLASSGNLPVGSVTYRIYVDMLPGYNFQTAYGDSKHELRLETTTSFFNNEDRGAISPTYTITQAKSNTVMLDSWLSVGGACKNYLGILKKDDNGVATVVNVDGILASAYTAAGIALSEQDGLIAPTVNQKVMDVTTIGLDTVLPIFDWENPKVNGQVFSAKNGAWAALGGATGPTDDNIVLIGQFTTNGVFSFKLNIQIGTPSGDAENYVAENPESGEYTLSSLSGTYGVKIIKPTVVISSPANGTPQMKDDIIQITANASDDGKVTAVEFFVDGVSIGTDNLAPFSAQYTCVTGTHHITAKATDNDGYTSTSDVVSIDVETTYSSIQSKERITVIPNPASNFITIQNAEKSAFQNAMCTIYDVLGNEIMSASITESGNIDIRQLKDGLYIIIVESHSIHFSTKFIKQ